jgi:hypothetical protein
MDWFKLAQNDWDVYQDPDRIRQFVNFGKITEEEYTKIVE